MEQSVLALSKQFGPVLVEQLMTHATRFTGWPKHVTSLSDSHLSNLKNFCYVSVHELEKLVHHSGLILLDALSRRNKSANMSNLLLQIAMTEQSSRESCIP